MVWRTLLSFLYETLWLFKCPAEGSGKPVESLDTVFLSPPGRVTWEHSTADCPVGREATGQGSPSSGSGGRREDAFQPNLLSTGVTELIQTHTALRALPQQEEQPYLPASSAVLNAQMCKRMKLQGEKVRPWLPLTQPPPCIFEGQGSFMLRS